MLCKYFHEDPNELLLKEDEDVPLNPCIVAHGPDVLTSKRFYIFVDKKCAFDYINSALEAVTLPSACYYVFNVRYPEELSATLELLQRNFANIDPLHGRKTKHHGQKAQKKGINDKLLYFYNAINNFEVLV
ncbi:uncharacterized protein LOC143461010 [Clavelina lepadiformis]|uniref:uncharacterized protein LOC143461010 n=1 Tax=Clavelina lepadiformis TaxID=159417 RepID=UPI00404150BA